MNRFLCFPLLAILVLAVPVSAVAAEPAVLAHASADRLWVARVSTVTTPAGPTDRTDILIRQSGPGQQWKELATFPARVTSLASRGSQLVAMLSNGSWRFVWGPDGASTGNPLPAGGRIRDR